MGPRVCPPDALGGESEKDILQGWLGGHYILERCGLIDQAGNQGIAADILLADDTDVIPCQANPQDPRLLVQGGETLLKWLDINLPDGALYHLALQG